MAKREAQRAVGDRKFRVCIRTTHNGKGRFGSRNRNIFIRFRRRCKKYYREAGPGAEREGAGKLSAIKNLSEMLSLIPNGIRIASFKARGES